MRLAPFRWHDWLLLAAVAAMLSGVATHARPPTSITLSQAGANGTYVDTNYVIHHFQDATYALAIIVIAILLHIALLRRASPTVAACGAVAIVLLILGLTLMLYPQVIFPAAMPRRYIDYPDAFARLSLLANVGAALGISALAALAGLSLRALLTRRHSS